MCSLPECDTDLDVQRVRGIDDGVTRYVSVGKCPHCDTRRCGNPGCGKQIIQPRALVCPHCGRDLGMRGGTE